MEDDNDNLRADENAGHERARKRKKYLEPGERYEVPRTTKWFQTTRNHRRQLLADEPATGSSCYSQPSTSGTVSSDEEVSEDGQQREPSGGDMPVEEETAEDTEGTHDHDWEDFLSKYSDVNLPNSHLSVVDALVAIMEYSASSGINWSQMEGLLKLISFFVGESALPRSAYLLRRIWTKMNGRMVKHHFFCEKCSACVGGPQAESACPNCGADVHTATFSQGNFFSTFDMKEQIQIALSNKTTGSMLMESLKQRRDKADCSMRDITDGTLYKKQVQQSAWSDITLTMNTDGARVFNSSKSSMWPLQCVINELPVHLRWANVVLGGLWFGKGHPDMVMFLEQFVSEVNNIGTIEWYCEGLAIKSRLQVVCACVDAPARSAILNTKQFNGFFGCTWCLHKGTYFKGSVKYPVNENGKPEKERTSAGVKEDMATALREGNPRHGVKGPSPLMNLEGLDLVWGICPDYMHCILEGVAKHLCEIWLTGTDMPCYIGSPATVAVVNTRLLHITPPQWFTRLPRTIADRQYWKASEWKWWLLCYAVPCLEGILPKKFLDHFCLLATATFLLLKDDLSMADIGTSSDMLAQFVLETQSLYGMDAMTFNIHQLLHLSKSALKLGPLWAHSTFVFESGNGSLLRLVSDGNGVPLQIAERFVMRQQLRKVKNLFPVSAQTTAFCKSIAAPQKERTTQVLGRGKPCINFSDLEVKALKDRLGNVPTEAVQFLRVNIDGKQFHSVHYERPKRTCNSVLMARDGHRYILERIYELSSGRIVLCCQRLLSHMHAKVLHLSRCVPEANRFRVLHTNEVLHICVSMKVGRLHYVSAIPNMYEKD